MEFAQKLLQLSNMEISLSKPCLMLLSMKLHSYLLPRCLGRQPVNVWSSNSKQVAIMNEQQMFALNYWGKAVKYFLLAGVKVWNRERTDNKVNDTILMAE
ncbi:uncharacterized protein [Triticum aestivum]|uniref:uncharacterized protein isoform X2 n=1 Tax=Triticum aestivum TaxID=4565 RepID=UPI001D02B6F7|nr:uncharacterized protein LOC123051795 isoform X2 [Triticum aestivum]